MLNKDSGIKVSISFFILILACYLIASPFEAASVDFTPSPLLQRKIQLGQVEHKNGNFDQAIKFFSEALSLAKKENSGQAELGCLMHLGILNWNKSQYEESVAFYSESLIKSQQLNLKTKMEEAQAALDIYKLYSDGYDFYSSGDYKKSVNYLNRALNLAKQYRSGEHELKCLQKLSLNYWEMDRVPEFVSLAREALELARRLKHKKSESLCLINLGIYYWKMDNLTLALQCYEESLTIARGSVDIKTEADCLNNLGIIYKELGNYEKALDYVNKSLKIDIQRNDEKNIVKDLNNIGTIFQEKERYSNNKEDILKALDYYRKSLDLAKRIGDKRTETSVLNNLGRAYANINKFSSALKYFLSALSKAEDIADEASKCMIYSNLGTSYFSNGNYKESEKFFLRAINLALELKSGRILWEAYFGLGQCYEKRGDYLNALDCYRKSMEIIDSIRSQLYIDIEKAGFARDKLRVYECYIDLLFSLNSKKNIDGCDKTIFSAVEEAKARAFLENLKQEKINIQENWSLSLKNEEEEISRIIAANVFALYRPDLPEDEKKRLRENINDAEDGYMRFISRVRLELPEIAGLIYARPCNVEEVQNQLLDEKSALIEYYLGDNRSYLFLITKTKFGSYILPPRLEIENSLTAYIRSFSPSPGNGIMADLAARRIFKELLFPLEYKDWGGIDRLIIIPDGILYYLPFEALQINNKKRYLVEQFKISYGPSASSLLYLSRIDAEMNSQRMFLGIGDPIYFFRSNSKSIEAYASSRVLRDLYLSEGFDLSPLPYSKKEILKIANYFPKESRRIYLGKDAREAVIKKGFYKDFQIVHFACHGFIDEKVPYRSALILSADEESGEDGLLQVREIYNLRIRANLVILSACQTGRGKLERSEGILGFPRIFFYAGAKSVISTLWKINDQSTAIFMDDFYKQLSLGNDKAEALRLAKLNMLKTKYSLPFYWAAFILSGDSRSKINFK